MVIEGTVCTLRSWRPEDAPRLAELADNPKIGRNMTEEFPSPYTLDDAHAWLAHCDDPLFHERMFAIALAGELAGGIGYTPQKSMNRYTADVGYWLGEAFWGRGVATDAMRAFVPWIFGRSELRRLEARVFAWNPASARVLEKTGFTLEGRLRNAVYRFDQFTDALIYGMLREDLDRKRNAR